MNLEITITKDSLALLALLCAIGIFDYLLVLAFSYSEHHQGTKKTNTKALATDYCAPKHAPYATHFS